jgi:succinoglycan biosynthesis transport protein ExoP
MTTLPQTTPIRLPRAGAGSQLAAPTTGGPIAAPATPSFSMTGSDVWRVIRANIWLILLMLVLSGGAGYWAYTYLAKNYSSYTAQGQVRLAPLESIDPLHPGPASDGGNMDIEKGTDMARFTNQKLQDDLMQDLDNPIRQTNWWKVTCGGDPEKAHEQLTQYLHVTSPPLSQLITVSMTTSDKKDCAVIVSAIIDRAIADQQAFIRAKFDADHERLVEQMNKYTIEYRAADADVKQMTAEIANKGGDLGGHAGVKLIELEHLVQEQIALEGQVVATDNAYTQFQDNKKNGVISQRVNDMVEADPEVIENRKTVEDLNRRILDLGEAVNSQAYIQTSKALERYQQKLDDLRAEKTAKISANYESEVTNAHKTAHEQLEQVDKHVAELKTQLAEVQNLQAAMFSRREDEIVFREFMKEYDKAIRDIEQMTQTSLATSLTLFDPPRPPTVPSFPKLGTIMPVALVLGLALSLGIAFLREVTDTTVRSPRDIVRIGQMGFLGMVPHESDDPQSSGARLPLVIFEAPHSMMAEQLRQVRTRLQHATSMDTTRSILVTSPSPGDGKSTIAVNLAAGLALNGRRILLVDSNFRRPELHRIFGVGNETGFSDVLNNVNAFASAVRETPVPNLSVMASGPKPSNPTELLESQLLLDFIERALEEYDHVIFDSGPMLFVSESVALAPRVDGVITVVRARTSSRGVLQRMRDGLRAVKAEHLGVVLNGVRSQAGGYYGRSIKTYYEYQSAE